MHFVTRHEGPKRFAFPVQRTIYFCKEVIIQIKNLINIMFQLLLKSCNITGSVFNVNPLTPNNPYIGRTAPLTSKVAFYVFIQQI